MEDGERLIAQVESAEWTMYKSEEKTVSRVSPLIPPMRGTDRTKDDLRH